MSFRKNFLHKFVFSLSLYIHMDYNIIIYNSPLHIFIFIIDIYNNIIYLYLVVRFPIYSSSFVSVWSLHPSPFSQDILKILKGIEELRSSSMEENNSLQELLLNFVPLKTLLAMFFQLNLFVSTWLECSKFYVFSQYLSMLCRAFQETPVCGSANVSKRKALKNFISLLSAFPTSCSLTLQVLTVLVALRYFQSIARRGNDLIIFQIQRYMCLLFQIK